MVVVKSAGSSVTGSLPWGSGEAEAVVEGLAAVPEPPLPQATAVRARATVQCDNDLAIASD